ncbi:MAG: nickel pincer cofactor biosynthesis protein LarB [Actinomycetota bacterium]
MPDQTVYSDAVAWLDHDRASRRGYPEAVYCEGKSPAQLTHIAARVRQFAQEDAAAGHATQPTLFTRVGAEGAAAILLEFPDALHDGEARLVAWPPEPPQPVGELVVVACAGTSDLPVAREAELTARYLGRPTKLLVDVGVAGIHRTLARLDVLREAGAVVVVAGMDGALPSVVAGLVRVPVVAVPTSIGYGAAFGGIAPLLAMLNACAPGVGVVNIDNGYGGAHLAAQITAPRRGADGQPTSPHRGTTDEENTK